MGKMMADKIDILGLIGKLVRTRDEIENGTIVAVRVDHHKHIFVEAKWSSPGRYIKRHWKPIEKIEFIEEI